MGYGYNKPQVFNTNTGTLQICALAGMNAGNFNITATILTDANCTCQ
ncbi:MAG: hypothetical protein ACOYLH_13235 [Flavobacteriales bacterium]